MSEINSSPPVSPPPPSSRPNLPAAELAVKLLQPMQGLLLSGETAKAEVIALKESAQSFQLLLRLTLDNGRQTTLQAESSRPLAQGSVLNVTALSDTRLSLLATGNTEKLLHSLDLNKLPVGTLLQGKVVSSAALPQTQAQQALYKVIVSLLNTPLAGSKLVVETPIPLAPGSLLSAQVQSNQSLSFLPLSSRLDQLVLTQQLTSNHNKQGSLEALLGALQGLRGQPPTAANEGLRQSIDKLFGALPDVAQLSTGKGLAQALENSGLLLENKLLSAQGSTLPADLKANLLRLISQLLPMAATAQPFAAAGASSALAHALPAMARNLLGGLDQAGSRQQALKFPLPSRLLQAMDGEADLETLLKLAAAAISRLQTHQLSSLAQSTIGPDGNLLTTWQLELPMRNQQEMIPLQLKIQRDEAQKKEKEGKKETLWKVELAFDLDPLGPLQVQAQLAHGQLSSQLWAERASTVSLIEAELDNLRQRLNAVGVQVSELACSQGKPPQGPQTNLEQRWVDETA